MENLKNERLGSKLTPPSPYEDINFFEIADVFALAVGDELQAACRLSADLPGIIRKLRFTCRPVQSRVGVRSDAVDDFNDEHRMGYEWQCVSSCPKCVTTNI